MKLYKLEQIRRVDNSSPSQERFFGGKVVESRGSTIRANKQNWVGEVSRRGERWKRSPGGEGGSLEEARVCGNVFSPLRLVRAILSPSP